MSATFIKEKRKNLLSQPSEIFIHWSDSFMQIHCVENPLDYFEISFGF